MPEPLHKFLGWRTLIKEKEMVWNYNNNYYNNYSLSVSEQQKVQTFQLLIVFSQAREWTQDLSVYFHLLYRSATATPNHVNLFITIFKSLLKVVRLLG
jgi:hypothetical protein